MSDPSARGNFVWYDLMTKDPVAAMQFYAAIAGWGTQQWSQGVGKTPYTMWTAGEKPIGGVMALPDELAQRGVPSHWIAYIGTPDVDATAKQAKELGGAVLHEPMDIPTVGRFAVIKDPQGAVFAVFTPLTQTPGRDGAPRPGEISWHELATTDHGSAFDFYAKLFGWVKTESMDMGEMGTYQMYGRDGKTLGGMFNASPGVPTHWFLYVLVDDADQTARTVTEHGGKVLNGPMDIPGGGRIAQCMDPQGAAFAVHANPKAA